MIYFKKSLKYNIKEKLICYRKKLDSLNILIEVAIKFNNKFYKLAINTYYNNPDYEARL